MADEPLNIQKEDFNYLKFEAPKNPNILLKALTFKNDNQLVERNITPLPNYSSWAMGIFGIVGSAKTTFYLNLTTIPDTSYCNVFDDIFAYMPSVDTVKVPLKIKPQNMKRKVDMKSVINQLRKVWFMGKLYEKFRDLDWCIVECKKAYIIAHAETPTHKSDEQNNAVMNAQRRYEILKRIIIARREHGFKPRYKCLFIFDDCLGDIENLCANRNNFNIFKKLVKNRRHIGDGICMIFTTQRFVDLPKAFRSNLSSIMMMSNADIGEIEALKKEKISISTKTLQAITDFIFDPLKRPIVDEDGNLDYQSKNFLYIGITKYINNVAPAYEYWNGLHTRLICGAELRSLQRRYGFTDEHFITNHKLNELIETKEKKKDNEEEEEDDMFDDDTYNTIAKNEVKGLSADGF